MATKIVYVSLVAAGKSEAVELITPNALNQLLEEGWDVSERKDHKIPDPLHAGKKLTVTEYVLTTKNRGLTVTKRERDPDREERRLTRLQDRAAKDVTGGALSRREDNGSFLGSGSSFHGLPGVGIVDSSTGAKGFMMGTDAFHADKLIEENPFQSGTLPHEQWARGWHAAEASQYGGDKNISTGEDPYELGKRAAKGPPDLEVSCPYPPGNPAYVRWLKGFEENGGDIK